MFKPRLKVLYGYRLDFTQYGEVLCRYLEGDIVDNDLAMLFSLVSGDNWSLNKEDDFTFDGAKVDYNGPNDKDFPTSNRYQFVLAIRLSPAYRQRRIYLQYNALKNKPQ